MSHSVKITKRPNGDMQVQNLELGDFFQFGGPGATGSKPIYVVVHKRTHVTEVLNLSTGITTTGVGTQNVSKIAAGTEIMIIINGK